MGYPAPEADRSQQEKRLNVKGSTVMVYSKFRQAYLGKERPVFLPEQKTKRKHGEVLDDRVYLAFGSLYMCMHRFPKAQDEFPRVRNIR